jgi:hypothetical protein
MREKMTRPDFRHEYLFVLGNGASIASADPLAKKLIKTAPTIDNFAEVMFEISQGRMELEVQQTLGEMITDASYDCYINRVIEVLKEKEGSIKDKKINISELLNILIVEGRNDDIDKLLLAVFETVISYYRRIHDKYFLKLWEIVAKSKSPVISLNWDTNFERVIYEKLNKQVPMKYYYGQLMLGHLVPNQRNEVYKPVVEIMKPNGSLNWCFDQNDKLAISDIIYSGPWIDELLHGKSFLIPPLTEKKWGNWHGYRPRMEKIREDINRRIRKYAVSTRTLVTIGYSFPDTDLHLQKLFAGNRFENVWVFDTNKDVFERIKGYFPGAKNKFKERGFAEIMNWPDVGEGLKPSRSE